MGGTETFSGLSKCSSPSDAASVTQRPLFISVNRVTLGDPARERVMGNKAVSKLFFKAKSTIMFFFCV